MVHFQSILCSLVEVPSRFCWANKKLASKSANCSVQISQKNNQEGLELNVNFTILKASLFLYASFSFRSVHECFFMFPSVVKLGNIFLRNISSTESSLTKLACLAEEVKNKA